MAKLAMKTPAAGLLPLTRGTVTATEVTVPQVWTIAAYPGREAALQAALPDGFPAPNRVLGKATARLMWCGRHQALWLGTAAPEAGLAQHAALTDQSSAWTVLRLEGEGIEDVLARLCPLDLSQSIFKRGHTARTLIGHMTAQVSRIGTGIEVMVFRSMAATLVHEVDEAMRSVAARGALSR